MASGGGACGSGACGSLPKLPEKPFQPTEIAFPRRPLQVISRFSKCKIVVKLFLLIFFMNCNKG